MNEKGLAMRFDSGKPMHELIPPFAINELAKIYEMGAKKYAPNNWRKGMKWSRVIASLKRHLNYIESGEDFDKESNLYHAAHIIWNAVTLLEYYKIYPQGDDRPHGYLNHPKIGLDIDEVICDWMGAWVKLHDLEVPTSWFFDRDIMKKFQEMRENGTLDNFYLGLQPKMNPLDIPFEPFAYVTSRPISTEITEKWLDRHGFPARPVITVPAGTSKVDVIKDSGIEIFIDDRFDNFTELNNAGICCYLWDSPHNQRYDVGFKRIKSLKELV